MKQWMKKLVNQFEIDWDGKEGGAPPPGMSAVPSGETEEEMSQDRATLLYVIDQYNKHLFEVDKHPVRKVREVLDEFAKELIDHTRTDSERVLFRFRQFFSSYRIDEYSFIQRTFDDFRTIIWDFVDQLSEDLKYEKAVDKQILASLEQLKEAVESNSIDDLKNQSRYFIDFYMEHQNKREDRRTERYNSMKKNLQNVKSKLDEANSSMRKDHLTGAFNRKSFDEHIRGSHKTFAEKKNPQTLIMLDIDHFKKVNDDYGHQVGDYILQECVKLLQKQFNRETDFVARVGGEEFAIVLNGGIKPAAHRCNKALDAIRNETFVTEEGELKFTVSMGLAELKESETVDAWMKRADTALYQSKNNGRNRLTISSWDREKFQVA